MKKRLVFLAIAVLTVAALLVVLYTKRGRRAESIRTTGTIEGVEVNLSSKVPGRILEIACEEGDWVRKGDIVIRLEADDLKAEVRDAEAGVAKAQAEVKVSESAIATAKASMANAEAEIRSAEADVEGARAQMEEAKRQLVRAVVLYKQEVISKQSYDGVVTGHDTAAALHASAKARLAAAQSKRDVSAAELAGAESRLDSARAGLRQAEAARSYSRAKLADTTIRSPISGTVVFKSLEKGETLSPGTTVLTIVDMNDLYARVDVDESMVGEIELKGRAVVRAAGDTNREFEGTIKEIGRYAEFATQRDVTRGRQDIRTFRVKIGVKNANGFLKPGMTVEVEIPQRTGNG